jgi:hypothetical protein
VTSVRKYKEKYFRVVVIYGKKVLKEILEKEGMKLQTTFFCLRIKAMVEFCRR